MLLLSGRSAGSRYGRIRTIQSTLLVPSGKLCATPISCDIWARQDGQRQVTMIESANCVNLCGLSRRRVQRDTGGEFLERKTCTGNGRRVVHWIDADGSACGGRGGG